MSDTLSASSQGVVAVEKGLNEGTVDEGAGNGNREIFPSGGPTTSEHLAASISPMTLAPPIPPHSRTSLTLTPSSTRASRLGPHQGSSHPLALHSPSVVSIVTINTNSSPSFTSTPKSASHVSRDALIGGIAGGLVGLLIITAILAYYLIRRFRRSKKNPPSDIPQFRNTESTLILDPKLHSPALAPDAPSISSQPPTSTNDSPNSMDSGAQQNTGESVNQGSLDNTLLQRDLMADQLTSRPNQPFQGLLHDQSISIRSDNSPANPNQLLREILNHGRNQDSGDENLPPNIQIFLTINDPSNVEGSTSNNRESRGSRVYHDQSASSNIRTSALDLPPSYD